ncbi:AMP-binding protein [Nocardia camponoti]|uniref:AMP-binding protein n=1 Tax=Nocardia camponoti TaxID=1616106 RepID=A0A917QQP7_9NOCA|nr:AMP-binding protein [Nocardia camponoti]GGK63223.1 AMP-binding protein [Nocardia camponoti]
MRELIDRLKSCPDREINCFSAGLVNRRTFADLYNDVMAMASALRVAGVSERQHIGICGQNSYEWVVSDLAAIEIGAVSVAFAPEHAAQLSTDDLVAQFDLSLLLLSADEYNRRLPETSAVTTFGDLDKVTAVPIGPSSVPLDTFSLAFSSGTSGTPKAIMMSTAGTIDAIEECHRQLSFRASDSIFVVLPLSAFPQRLMVYIAIWCGFDIHLASIPDLFAASRALRPTIVVGPPAFFEALVMRYRDEHRDGATITLGPEAFGGNVRLALTGAAPARKESIEFLNEVGFPLYEFYGLTETSAISWNTPAAHRPGSVGRLLRPGIVKLESDGEILVRMVPPRSHGYYGEPSANASTYLADGWIATGDIGRFDGDYLYITGRKKSVIITRAGYKLQPEPIEQALCAETSVAHAVVLGGEHAPVVTAVVSVHPNGVCEQISERLNQILDERNGELPPPARVVRLVVTRQPFTTQNGLLTRTLKVDRGAVAAMLANQESTGSELNGG